MASDSPYTRLHPAKGVAPAAEFKIEMVKIRAD